MEPMERIGALEPGFYMCGDHLQTSSIEGAVASGRRAAEAMIKERKLTAD
jgi:predicted NAD/FAD-dependent oxidoreductase